MTLSIEVTEEFVAERERKVPLYNKKAWKRGMTDAEIRAAKMRIDCELYEYAMIKSGDWEEEPDDWKIDGYIISDAGHTPVDVKTISKYFNIDRYKMLNIIRQRDAIDGFVFVEWIDRPDRPTEVGDVVTIGVVGYLSFDEVLDNLLVSGKTDGYYVDVRKLVQNFDYDVSEL